MILQQQTSGTMDALIGSDQRCSDVDPRPPGRTPTGRSQLLRLPRDYLNCVWNHPHQRLPLTSVRFNVFLNSRVIQEIEYPSIIRHSFGRKSQNTSVYGPKLLRHICAQFTNINCCFLSQTFILITDLFPWQIIPHKLNQGIKPAIQIIARCELHSFIGIWRCIFHCPRKPTFTGRATF